MEIIAVDDGSTDETVTILSEYAARDSRIRIHRNGSNLGLVANWNRCLELASGQWIKFAFQDDLLDVNCVDRLLAAGRNGAHFVACNRHFEFEQGTDDSVVEFYLEHKRLVEELYAQKHMVAACEFAAMACQKIGANVVGEPTTTLIHRTVFEKFGGFNETLVMSCDLEYWTRIGGHVGLHFIADELATFRVHRGSTSAANRRDKQYRMVVLDDLLIWNQVVNDPHYAPIRDAARRCRPSIPLKQTLERKAHIARATAERVDRASAPHERSILADWEKCTDYFPALQVGGLRHLAWRVWNRKTVTAAERKILTD